MNEKKYIYRFTDKEPVYGISVRICPRKKERLS